MWWKDCHFQHSNASKSKLHLIFMWLYSYNCATCFNGVHVHVIDFVLWSLYDFVLLKSHISDGFVARAQRRLLFGDVFDDETDGREHFNCCWVQRWLGPTLRPLVGKHGDKHAWPQQSNYLPVLLSRWLQVVLWLEGETSFHFVFILKMCGNCPVAGGILNFAPIEEVFHQES